MITKEEVKRNIMRKIMELRTKDLIEEDSILDVLDDNLDTYIDDICKERDKYKGRCEHYEKCIMQMREENENSNR